jgi:membrane protein DedA with SNARE-associated domain/membrane-associated phospholipid phosphatase
MSPAHVAAAVVAVLLAAGAIWRRRRITRERLVGSLVLAVVLGVYASGVLSALPDPKQTIVDVAQALGAWTYALVGVSAFLETGAFVGLVAPGETVVLAGGVIAGQGEIDLLPLIGVVWACAVLGDSTSFFIGRRLGRAFLLRHGPKVKISKERLQQVEGYFARHGGKTILIGRFIGLVRALAPFVAGSSRMPYQRFLPFSVVGTGLWGTAYCVLGYVFWQSFDKVAKVAGQAVFAFGVTIAVIVGVVWLVRRLRRPEERRRLMRWLERVERTRAGRPLFAVLRPVWRVVLGPAGRAVATQARFIWNRLTPGELGLELTTSLAVAGAGVYAFVLFTSVVSADPTPTRLDRELFKVAHRLHTSAAVDAAKIVTSLGALPVAAAIVAVTAVVLAVRRHHLEAAALVTGSVGVYIAVQLAKAGVDRPRPPHPLVATRQSSFPSGHAAYSTVWVAAAALIGRRRPLAGRAALILTALAVSAAVGLSRVYLRAHYFSDVAAGWGLGFGILTLAAIVALVVGYIRHNGHTAAEPGSGQASAHSR